MSDPCDETDELAAAALAPEQPAVRKSLYFTPEAYATGKKSEQPAAQDRLVDRFPELNMSNYNDSDVDALNAWGIEAADALATQQAEIAELKEDKHILTAAAAKAEQERDELKRQLRFKTNLAISILADAERAEAERDALKADAERYRWLRFGLCVKSHEVAIEANELCLDADEMTEEQFDIAVSAALKLEAARRGE